MSKNQRNSAWGIPPPPEVCIGPSRRNPGAGRKEHISQRRPPPRDDASLEPLLVTDQQPLDSLTQGSDRIIARFDKLESRWEEIDRRRRNTVYQQWHQEQFDHSSCNEQPPGWPPPPWQCSAPTGWSAQRHLHAYGQQQWRYAYGQQQQRNPYAEYTTLPDYQPPCPPYTDPDSYGQPRNFDDGYHPRPLSEYQPPQPLPEYLPPRPLQVSDCSQHQLQQAAINDYNEKLRVYRLEQAALLARLNAWFEENTSDENLAEEKNDNTPVIVLGDDPPTDITGVPNDGATLDIPNNESVEEIVKKEGIVKNENELLPVLVEAYDDKIGDLIAPIHQELEIKDDAKKGFYVENLMEKCVSCYEDFTRMLIKSQSKRKIERVNRRGRLNESIEEED